MVDTSQFHAGMVDTSQFGAGMVDTKLTGVDHRSIDLAGWLESHHRTGWFQV